MTPVHISPCATIRVVLVKKMVKSFIKEQPIWIVEPATFCCKMKLWAIWFFIETTYAFYFVTMHSGQKFFQICDRRSINTSSCLFLSFGDFENKFLIFVIRNIFENPEHFIT